MATEKFTGQDVFQLLRPEQVNALSEVAEEISLRSGETVFSQGSKAEHMFVVLDGQVSLRLPRSEGVSLVIDEAREGAMFGHCICLELRTYPLTAICAEDSRLLKIKAEGLKKLMDEELIMGRAIQALISRVYFQRYLETMKKLQAVVQAIPLA